MPKTLHARVGFNVTAAHIAALDDHAGEMPDTTSAEFLAAIYDADCVQQVRRIGDVGERFGMLYDSARQRHQRIIERLRRMAE